jgi:hypothetical protein
VALGEEIDRRLAEHGPDDGSAKPS